MGKVRQNKNWLMRIFTTNFVFKNDFSVKLHSYKLNLSLNVSIVPPPLCIFNSRLSLITLKASLRSWWRRYASQVRAVASVPGILVSMAGLVGALGGWIWLIGCSTGSILCSFLATSPSCGVTSAPSLRERTLVESTRFKLIKAFLSYLKPSSVLRVSLMVPNFFSPQ